MECNDSDKALILMLIKNAWETGSIRDPNYSIAVHQLTQKINQREVIPPKAPDAPPDPKK